MGLRRGRTGSPTRRGEPARASYHQGGAVGGAGHPLGEAAQQQALVAVGALGADHDQVALPLAGEAHDDARGAPSLDEGAQLLGGTPSSRAWALAWTAISVAYCWRASPVVCGF